MFAQKPIEIYIGQRPVASKAVCAKGKEASPKWSEADRTGTTDFFTGVQHKVEYIIELQRQDLGIHSDFRFPRFRPVPTKRAISISLSKTSQLVL